MNTNRIFIGDIYKNKELVSKNVVLLKCKNDVYVPINNVNCLEDIYKINHERSLLLTYKTVENDWYYYIDKDSLVPYYDKSRQKTLHRIKRDILCDARNPIGIDN